MILDFSAAARQILLFWVLLGKLFASASPKKGFNGVIIMDTYTLTKLTAQNYKNLALSTGLELDKLNVFIGPNGSGKSNLTNVLRFLKDSISDAPDEGRGRTGFEDAVFRLGGTRILDATIKAPATIKLGVEFASAEHDSRVLDLELLVQDSVKPVMIKQESLRSPRKNWEQGFFYYKSHDRFHGEGVVSVYNDDSKSNTHFEKLSDVPVNDLTLVSIPAILESTPHSPENTPVYQVRRQLIEMISQWRFYNANEMNLTAIREAEPKIGPRDQYLSNSCENLPRVLHNLMQESIDFEEQINHAMRAILPTTRRIRAVHSGRLSLTVEWHFEEMNEPFYLSEMSDGTVRMLCWATILLSPTLPSLLVIDEPELGLHVAWMPILAEWIKLSASKTQVIVCTHSPDLLDHFTDKVENVIVFHQASSDKSHFCAKALSKEHVAEWIEEGWQLGDLYRVGNPSVGGWPSFLSDFCSD